MIASKRNIVGVAFEGRNQRLRGVVPYLDCPVIRGCEKIWLVRVGVVVDVINALCLMCLEGEVRRRGAETPDLDRPVEAGRRKRVCVFRVNGQPHDVVAMTLEHLDALPAFIPIPELYGHVIGRRQDEGLRGVDGDGADVVRVGFERRDFLGGIVVVNPDLEVV
jgi:hypothetical protein